MTRAQRTLAGSGFVHAAGARVRKYRTLAAGDLPRGMIQGVS